MYSSSDRFPLWRIALSNTVWMSAAYFSLAILSEALRKYFARPSATHLLMVLETLPARVLKLLGVWNFLEEKYLFGMLNEVSFRLILGATMVVMIFGVSLLVTAVLWLLRRPGASAAR